MSDFSNLYYSLLFMKLLFGESSMVGAQAYSLDEWIFDGLFVWIDWLLDRFVYGSYD